MLVQEHERKYIHRRGANLKELQMKFIGNQTVARLFQTLSVLEEDHMFTIKSLSEQTGVSERTIIKDINALKEIFSEIANFSSSINGYQFEEINLLDYKEQKQKLLETELWESFFGEKDTIEDVSEYCDTSASTVRRLLLQVYPLQHYTIIFL